VQVVRGLVLVQKVLLEDSTFLGAWFASVFAAGSKWLHLADCVEKLDRLS
jgi:hypothetical protein